MLFYLTTIKLRYHTVLTVQLKVIENNYYNY